MRTVTSPDSTYVTIFDPAKPTDVCKVWTSLAAYCSGAGTDCNCYSAGAYVPDQWNSLARGCATYAEDPHCSGADTDPWCRLASTAFYATDDCTTSGLGPRTTPFGAFMKAITSENSASVLAAPSSSAAQGVGQDSSSASMTDSSSQATTSCPVPQSFEGPGTIADCQSFGPSQYSTTASLPSSAASTSAPAPISTPNLSTTLEADSKNIVGFVLTVIVLTWYT